MDLAVSALKLFVTRARSDRDQSANVPHDEMTVIDRALVRPWTVDKRYLRTARPTWTEAYCLEGTALIFVGLEEYDLSGDGCLPGPAATEPEICPATAVMLR